MRFKPKNILIEDKASGTQLIQELIARGRPRSHPLRSEGLDKIMRLHSVTSTIENGFVYLPGTSRVARLLPPRTDDLSQRQAR